MSRRYFGSRFIPFLAVIALLLWILLHSNHSCPQCERVLSSDDQGEKRTRTYEIPPIVHFITGQGDASESLLDRFGPRLGLRRMESASSDFQLIHYLVLLSARRQIRPEQLFVHYSYEPSGYWWEKAKEDLELNMTTNLIPVTTSIYEHPLHHHAHRTDVARLATLDQYGGIYLDMDVLVLRSFSELLANDPQVEAIFAWETEEFRSICNAVIVAPIRSKFLRRMYHAYQSFNSSCWGCHSVLLTGRLADVYPKEVLVLPSRAFFSPSWANIEELYVYNRYNFRENYACHLWNSFVGKHFLHNLTIEAILKPHRKTTFLRMLVQAIGREKLTSIVLP